MKHTPKPWKIKEEGVDDFKTGCLEINHPDNEDICIALCYLTNPNMKEDARLIASAPDLLEACKKALLKEEIMPENWKSKDLIKTLEQAIAKAEGGNV